MTRGARLRAGICVIVAVVATVTACAALVDGAYVVAGAQVCAVLAMATLWWRGIS